MVGDGDGGVDGEQLHVDGEQLQLEVQVDGGHCGQPPLCSAQSHQSPFSTKA